jgi:hypothetical protein
MLSRVLVPSLLQERKKDTLKRGVKSRNIFLTLNLIQAIPSLTLDAHFSACIEHRRIDTLDSFPPTACLSIPP